MVFFRKNKKDDAVKAEALAKFEVEKKGQKKIVKNIEKTTGKRKAVATRGSRIILGPVVTEKTAHLSENNVIVLKVAKRANKVQIAQEIKALYGIIPSHVATINLRGKKVRFGGVNGKRSDTKKAMITLPKGKSLDIFEGV